MGNVVNLEKANLLGFDINKFSMSEAVEYALNLIKTRQGGQVVTINPEMIQSAKSNGALKDIIENAPIVLPDGVGIKLGLKLKNVNIHRVAGIEFAYNMLKECAKNKYTVALVGAKPHIVSAACKNLKEQISDLKIVYYHNGYFSDEDRVLNELKRNVPKLVLVAMGSPYQEIFINKARKLLPTSLMIGVGGSFDVWSGNVKRAPKIYQKFGLEWLYRTIKEPFRIKRIFPAIPKFMFRVFLEDVLKLK